MFALKIVLHSVNWCHGGDVVSASFSTTGINTHVVQIHTVHILSIADSVQCRGPAETCDEDDFQLTASVKFKGRTHAVYDLTVEWPSTQSKSKFTIHFCLHNSFRFFRFFSDCEIRTSSNVSLHT